MTPSLTGTLEFPGGQARVCIVTQVGVDYALVIPPDHVPIGVHRTSIEVIPFDGARTAARMVFTAQPVIGDPDGYLPLIIAAVPKASLPYWLDPPAGVLAALFDIADRAVAGTRSGRLH